MKILLTGGAGFIGAHIAEHILANTDWQITGLVSFRHRGCPLRLAHLDQQRFRIIYHDLNAPISERLAAVIGPVDHIINAAAESHVDRSLTDPVAFVQNNVNLALNMLEYARIAAPKMFVQVSTDEVYGPAPAGYRHKEWDTVIPSNPYSASKAAQEAVAISYWRSFGVPLCITNTMNNFGERQDKEKFIPLVLSKVLNGETVTIHGDTTKTGAIGSRFYMHARNHADALLHILRHCAPQSYPALDRPLRFNIVGEKELSNLDMAQLIAECAGKPLRYEIEDFHRSRPGHDLRYALDGSLLAAAGWTAKIPLEESLRRAVAWTMRHPEWLK